MLPAARAAFVLILAELKGDGDSQLRDILPYAPQTYGSIPLAYLGNARTVVTPGMRQVWKSRVPFSVITAMRGNYASEMAYLAPFAELINDLIVANVSLNETVNAALLDLVEDGILTGVNGQEYVGFTMYYDIIRKRNVTYGHHG